MKRFLTIAVCTGALMGVPVVYGQATPGNSGNGGGGSTTSSSMQPMPHQAETSQGAVVNPPPLDRSGNPTHVSDKQPNTGNGSGDAGAAADNGADSGGDGQNGSGMGSTTGESGMGAVDSGTGGTSGGTD